jgi:hypothetical protein
MNPTLDHAIVAAIVMGAFGYFLARFVRRRRAGKACASDCGCSVASKPLTPQSK